MSEQIGGWIALHKKILGWEWYDDANTMRLFMHCLLKANFKDTSWRGNAIKRGEFISSIDTLSRELKLSVKQIRTAINKLKKTSELASKSTSQHTVFKVINYNEYQQEGKQEDKQETSKGQAEGKRRATDEKGNKENKENKKDIKPSSQELFDQFWKAYPKKRSKGQALKTWKQLKPDEQLTNQIILAIELAKTSVDWMKNGGEFISNPSTWLNATGWEDELNYTNAQQHQSGGYQQEPSATTESFLDDDTLAELARIEQSRNRPTH